MRLRTRLLHQQRTEPPVTQSSVRVGPGNHEENLRFTGESAPGLGAVQQPTVLDWRSPERETRNIGTIVGLGNGDTAEHITRGNSRQPLQSLRLRSSSEQGTRENFRASDQATCRRQRSLRERLGNDDHRQIVCAIVRCGAAVLLRNRDTENTHLAHGLQDVLRYSEVLPVNALGAGGDDVICQAPESGLHHGFIVVELDFTDVCLKCDDVATNIGQPTRLQA